MTDEALVKAILAGNREAFLVLYERCRYIVDPIVWRFVDQQDDAADLSQDIWHHILCVLPRWRPSGSLEGWVLRVATNKAREWIRRRQRHGNRVTVEGSLFEGVQDDAVDTVEKMDRQAVQDAFHACLDCITHDGQRRALLLWLNEYSYQEIATILDTSINTVGVWIRRAKQTIHDCLRRRLPGRLPP